MSAKAACRGREWLISACMVGAKLVRLWRNSEVARWANAVASQDSKYIRVERDRRRSTISCPKKL
jgi:hypothetical protein